MVLLNIPISCGARDKSSEQAQQVIERNRSRRHDPLTWKWGKAVTYPAQGLLSCSANALGGWDPDRPLVDMLLELVQSMVGKSYWPTAYVVEPCRCE